MIGYFARDTSAFRLTRGVSEMFTISTRPAPQKERVHTYRCNETVKVDGIKYFGNCLSIKNESKRNAIVFKKIEMVDSDERTLFAKVSDDKIVLFFIFFKIIVSLFDRWMDSWFTIPIILLPDTAKLNFCQKFLIIILR